eukprot:2539632-Pleurochrysis_carterae.AAC.1
MERTATDPLPNVLISKAVGGQGGGLRAVEALDRLLSAAEPNTPKRDFPCPWILLFGDCKKGAPDCNAANAAANAAANTTADTGTP